jgi:membrane-bound serine protease (ClpP class)
VYVVPALSLKQGDLGVAHTSLRPSGKIIINERKLDAITRGDFIEQGVSIIVDCIENNKIIVKRGN